MATSKVGKVLTTLTVTNRIDEANAKQGVIPPEAVRTVTLQDVLVDTGAMTLCLSKEAIAALGLELLREVGDGTR